MKDLYEDIINLPHHVSKTRPQMSMLDRAAQFSPFAALAGHDAAIRETARLTETRVELDENELAELDSRMQWIEEHLEEEILVKITYFQPDSRKSGGSYAEVIDRVQRIDRSRGMIWMRDGSTVLMREVVDITIEKKC